MKTSTTIAKLMLFFSFIISHQGLASESKVSCLTQPLSTSYFLRTVDEGGYTLSIIHHNGIEHAPLYNGVITQYTLDDAKEKLENLYKLGQEFTVAFDSDDCKFTEDRISCFYDNSSKIGELEVKNYYFSVHKENHITPFGEFTQHTATFNYRLDSSRSHDIRLNYYANDCLY